MGVKCGSFRQQCHNCFYRLTVCITYAHNLCSSQRMWWPATEWVRTLWPLMVGTSPLPQGATPETLFKMLPSTPQPMTLLTQGSLARMSLHVTIYYTPLRHECTNHLELKFYLESVLMQRIQEDCYKWSWGGLGPVNRPLRTLCSSYHRVDNTQFTGNSQWRSCSGH